jgi:hypothetical protein
MESIMVVPHRRDNRRDDRVGRAGDASDRPEAAARARDTPKRVVRRQLFRTFFAAPTG